MYKLEKLSKRHFLSSSDLNIDELNRIFDLTKKFKSKDLVINFKEKVLGLIFDKASTRTRVSFQVAMSRLGGSTIDLNPSTSQIGRGESIKDTARVLSRYCDAIAVRTYEQNNLEEYAKWSEKPIINALTDLEHPCQALADFYTVYEEFGEFNNLTLTFIGDGNNVANSLILCGTLLGINIRVACPPGYEPNLSVIRHSRELSNESNNLIITKDVKKAVSGSDILYTDVWSSMGEESNSNDKDRHFSGFTLNKTLLEQANENAIVLHCLPAYRGKEITDEVIESNNSRIFDQAENRMHVQQALLALLLSE